MASSITNYSSFINVNFPTPGEDNDSQVFRDNFSRIQQGLNIAGQEISSLQINSVLASKENNFGDNIIKQARLQDCSVVVNDESSIIQEGSIKIDYRDGSYQRLSVNSGTHVLTILNWPGTESAGFLNLEIQSISLGSTYIVFSDSNIVNVGTDSQPFKLTDLNKEIFNVWSNGELGYTFVQHVTGGNVFNKNISLGNNNYITFDDDSIFIGDITTSTMAAKSSIVKTIIGRLDTGSTGTYYGIGSNNVDLHVASTNDVIIGRTLQANKIVVNNASLRPSASGSMTLGSSSATFTAVWASNGTIQTSDARKKVNVQESTLGLTFINDLVPKSYKYQGENQTRHGLIAQEVKAVIDQHGAEFAGWVESDDVDKTQHLIYSEFIAPLIKSVKELKTEIENIKKHLGL